MKIAFMGVSGSGKDFLADYLISNYNFIRLSFSDQLKKLSKFIYPWMEEDYPSERKALPLNITLPTGELIHHTPRDIWLNLNGLRKIENKIFIRMLSSEMKLLEKNNTSKINIIITDIRSNEEFLWCKENHFTVIYINRTENDYKKYPIDKHVIENKYKTDYQFDNDTNGTTRFKSFFDKVLCGE